jgi:FkbM family methyltransferase
MITAALVLSGAPQGGGIVVLGQAIESVRRIVGNPYVSTVPALWRYASWQARCARRRFPVELKISRSVVTARSGDCGVSALINAHGAYDYDNMHLIQELVTEGVGFVDVGANIGSYTLIASECATAQVLAIEPHPLTFEALAANVMRNRRTNVRLVRAAAGSAEGNVCITDTPGSTATHIVYGDTSLKVRLRRLDVLLDEVRVTPNVVKIDVEGYEFAVLQGLGERLRGVRVLFVDINGLIDARGEGARAVLALLEAAGFGPAKYYDARRRALVDAPVIVGEDPVFVNRAYSTELLRRCGIR